MSISFWLLIFHAVDESSVGGEKNQAPNLAVTPGILHIQPAPGLPCVLLYPALHLVVQKSSPAPLTPPNLCRKHHTISPFSLHPLQVSTAIQDPCKAPGLQGRLRIGRTASGLDSQRQGSPSSFQRCCKVIWSLIGKMGSPSLQGSHLEKVW